MDGLSRNGIKIFLGELPGRKQECFYFIDSGSLYVAAYIRKESLEDAKRLWGKFIEDKPNQAIRE